jgi:hypothetical protein
MGFSSSSSNSSLWSPASTADAFWQFNTVAPDDETAKKLLWIEQPARSDLKKDNCQFPEKYRGARK